MNRTFKTVWNQVRRCHVVVNEKARASSKASGKAALIGLALALPLCGDALSAEVSSAMTNAPKDQAVDFGDGKEHRLTAIKDADVRITNNTSCLISHLEGQSRSNPFDLGALVAIDEGSLQILDGASARHYGELSLGSDAGEGRLVNDGYLVLTDVELLKGALVNKHNLLVRDELVVGKDARFVQESGSLKIGIDKLVKGVDKQEVAIAESFHTFDGDGVVNAGRLVNEYVVAEGESASLRTNIFLEGGVVKSGDKISEEIKVLLQKDGARVEDMLNPRISLAALVGKEKGFAWLGKDGEVLEGEELKKAFQKGIDLSGRELEVSREHVLDSIDIRAETLVFASKGESDAHQDGSFQLLKDVNGRRTKIALNDVKDIDADITLSGSLELSGSKAKMKKLFVNGGELVVNEGLAVEIAEFVSDEKFDVKNKGELVALGNSFEIMTGRVENEGILYCNKVVLGEEGVLENQGVFGASEFEGNINVPSGAAFVLTADRKDLSNAVDGLVVKKPVNLEEGSSLAVGTVKADGADSIVVGADGRVLVDIAPLEGKPVFSSQGGRMIVQKGAVLDFGEIAGLPESGDVLIGKNFAVSDDWGSLAVLRNAGDASGHAYEMTAKTSDSGEPVVAFKKKSLVDSHPDVLLPGLEQLDRFDEEGADPKEPDLSFVQGVLSDTSMTMNERDEVLRQTAEVGALGGVMQATHGAVHMIGDVLQGHWTRYEGKSNDLWVDVMSSHASGKSDAWSMGDESMGLKSSRNGVVLGLDSPVREDLVAGVAVAYMRDKLEGRGYSTARNKAATGGVSVYADWQPSSEVRLGAQLAWLRTTNKIDLELPGEKGSVRAEPKTNAYVVSMRGDRVFRNDGVSFVPHAGVSMIHAKVGSYSTDVNGRELFSTSCASRTTFELPLGLSVSAQREFSGWKVEPVADVTAASVFGNRKARYTVTGISGGSQTHEADFAGGYYVKAGCGLKAFSDSDGLYAGLFYDLFKSKNGVENRALIELRKAF